MIVIEMQDQSVHTSCDIPPATFYMTPLSYQVCMQ